MTADACGLQLALDHDLRGNAGMVGARNPGGVETRHAVVTRQAVHDGLVERVPHVQRAGHVGRWQLDAEVVATRGSVQTGLARAPATGHTIAAFFPFGAPMGFQGSGLE